MPCAGWLPRIDKDRCLQLVRQEDQFGIRTVIQFVLKIGRRECVCDGLLRLGLSDGPNTEPFCLTIGPNPDRIPLAFRPCAGNLGILGRNGRPNSLCSFSCSSPRFCSSRARLLADNRHGP